MLNRNTYYKTITNFVRRIVFLGIRHRSIVVLKHITRKSQMTFDTSYFTFARRLNHGALAMRTLRPCHHPSPAGHGHSRQRSSKLDCVALGLGRPRKRGRYQDPLPFRMLVGIHGALLEAVRAGAARGVLRCGGAIEPFQAHTKSPTRFTQKGSY